MHSADSDERAAKTLPLGLDAQGTIAGRRHESPPRVHGHE